MGVPEGIPVVFSSCRKIIPNSFPNLRCTYAQISIFRTFV